MRTANTRPQYREKRFSAVTLIAVFALLAVIVAVPFYSARSSSLPTSARQPSVPVQAPAITRPSGSLSNLSQAGWPSIFQPLLPAPEGIATFNSDCVTPQTDFFLGDIVCAKASGAPNSLFPWQILWVDPDGFVRDNANASTDDATTYMYQLPATATSTVNDETVDNRGTWDVSLARSSRAKRQTARFTVHEAANPVADVFVQKFNRSGDASVSSGNNIDFIVVVGNAGPDPATAVNLVDSPPAGATLVQITQNSGPACLPAGESPCAIASMANGDRAEFTVIYNTGSMAVGTYETSATVSNTTPDPNSSNDTATATFTVTANTGTTECQLLCPDNVNATANTTEGGNRGAHVTFDDAVSSGTCGTVTATPASGSFFPVGQTVVTVTSETGGGSCTFTVNVEDTGTNPPTISCPPNKQGTANNDCEATIVLGNPTTTGDNVTVHVTRSDGKPMYNCDVNGENCVRKTTDLPFATGVTTVTWTATSHDSQGNELGNSSCTQTVTVDDVTPPVIAATDQTVSADASCQAAVPDYSTTVSDNCACSNSDTSEDCQGHPHFTVTQTPAAGTVVGLGTYTIHIEANDNSSNNGGAGNTSTKDITLTVADTTAPTFTFVPANITVFTGSGATTCDAVVDPGTATANDNCSAVTITRSPSGNTFPVGTTTIVWTAKDVALNAATANQTVTVIDNTPPTISCPASITLEPTCPSGAIGTYATPVGTDNCPSTTTRTAGLASGAVFPIGTTTVTHTVTDQSGNSASCSFTVTVLTPQAVIQNLISSVNASSLTGTQKNGLLAKLNAALTAINGGGGNACAKLSDFVSNVQTLISHGDLTAAQGNAWILSANHVRNTIGCTNNPCS